MIFTEKFEPIVRTVNNDILSLGLYDTYEEANDRAIVFASKDLPNECITAYQIVKCYINANIPMTESIQQGG